MYKYHLKILREWSGLSQAQFVNYVSLYGGHLLNFTTISRHENILSTDSRGISFVNLSYYAKAYHLGVVDLYGTCHTEEDLLQYLLLVWAVPNIAQFQEALYEHMEKTT